MSAMSASDKLPPSQLPPPRKEEDFSKLEIESKVTDLAKKNKESWSPWKHYLVLEGDNLVVRQLKWSELGGKSKDPNTFIKLDDIAAKLVEKGKDISALKQTLIEYSAKKFTQMNPKSLDDLTKAAALARKMPADVLARITGSQDYESAKERYDTLLSRAKKQGKYGEYLDLAFKLPPDVQIKRMEEIGEVLEKAETEAATAYTELMEPAKVGFTSDEREKLAALQPNLNIFNKSRREQLTAYFGNLAQNATEANSEQISKQMDLCRKKGNLTPGARDALMQTLIARMDEVREAANAMKENIPKVVAKLVKDYGREKIKNAKDGEQIEQILSKSTTPASIVEPGTHENSFKVSTLEKSGVRSQECQLEFDKIQNTYVVKNFKRPDGTTEDLTLENLQIHLHVRSPKLPKQQG